MRWTEDQFKNAVQPVLKRYTQDNSWFTWRTEDLDVHVKDAWNLYYAANTNALGMLLLGDAKIRTNSPLMMNFGLASGNSLKADAEKAGIDKVQAQRDQLGAGLATSVLGTGSILNDQLWSPLMNDAFILAGVHDEQEFHWAEEEFDQFDARAAATARRSASFHDTDYYRALWKQYLLGGDNFWRGGFVRVFARELIGLNAFGYKPRFSKIGVAFEWSDPSGFADFSKYLDALDKAGFSKGDSAAINAALGRYLFNDSAALAGLSKAGAR
jgi:hypothetical protein